MDTTTQQPPDDESPPAGNNNGDQTDLFQRLTSYPFHTDREFAKGLSIILGHPDSPATDAEIQRDDDLVLQAKCFYFSRKEKLSAPLDFAAYKAWLSSGTTESSQVTAQQQEPLNPSAQSATSDQSVTQSQEPAYPSSFAHIVDLITTGQPVPGIEEIPDTVLTGHDTTSAKPRRRKPWEIEDAEETTDAQ